MITNMANHFFLIALLLSITPYAFAGSLRVEGGTVFTGYNSYKIPKDTGTFVELPKKNFNYYRIETEFDLSEKSVIRLVYAPLQTKYTQPLTDPVTFEGVTFNSGSELKTNFKFNSYRLGYIRNLMEGPLTLRWGLVGKVRDAHIIVSDSTSKKSKKNVGFVPLLHFDLQAQITGGLHFIFDIDGLASSQGRAVDARAELSYAFLERAQIGVLYRVLEGGADNSKLRNFSQFKYTGLSLAWVW